METVSMRVNLLHALYYSCYRVKTIKKRIHRSREMAGGWCQMTISERSETFHDASLGGRGNRFFESSRIDRNRIVERIRAQYRRFHSGEDAGLSASLIPGTLQTRRADWMASLLR